MSEKLIKGIHFGDDGLGHRVEIVLSREGEKYNVVGCGLIPATVEPVNRPILGWSLAGELSEIKTASWSVICETARLP